MLRGYLINNTDEQAPALTELGTAEPSARPRIRSRPIRGGVTMVQNDSLILL